MLDFGSLLMALMVLQVLQALGFLHVWRAHPEQEGARLWAIGSALVAAGVLLVALRGPVPPVASILGGNLAVFAGLLVFDFGIARACAARPPWRAGLLLVLAAFAAHAWFTLAAPSASARIWTLTAVMVACNGYAALVAWRAREGELRGLHALIAAFLVLEIGFALVRAVGASQGELLHALQSTPAQTWPLLGMIATRFALTLLLGLMVSARLQIALRHAALHDPLTGLLNRRAFADLADREWSRLRRSGGSAVALMIDLDHFKRFNDANGHAADDHALRQAARAIAAALRREDHVCRYGGEEFAVLLSGTGGAPALAVAERLRRTIAGLSVCGRAGATTASIGLAEGGPAEGGWQDLLGAADQALYEAKAQGRNRVAVFAAPRVTGLAPPREAPAT